MRTPITYLRTTICCADMHASTKSSVVFDFISFISIINAVQNYMIQQRNFHFNFGE